MLVSSGNKFTWETTGTIETAQSLKRMYKGIPMCVIKDAINDGVRDFDSLFKRWQEHNVQIAKNIAVAQRSSVKHMRGWQLAPSKSDWRDFRDK